MAPMSEKLRYHAKGGWVVLRQVEKKAGAIMLLNAGDRVEKYAEVVDVGPGYYQNGQLIEPDVEVGDLVVVKGGPRVFHGLPEDQTHGIVWCEDIICTLDTSVPIPEQPKTEALPTVPLVQMPS